MTQIERVTVRPSRRKVLLEVFEPVHQSNGIPAPEIDGVTPNAGEQHGKRKLNLFELVQRRVLYVWPCDGSTNPGSVPAPRCRQYTQRIPRGDLTSCILQ